MDENALSSVIIGAAIDDVHLAQTLTYLRLGHFKLGLLINFNTVVLRDGIRRVVNNL